MTTLIYYSLLLFVIAQKSLTSLVSGSEVPQEATFYNLQHAAKLSSAAYRSCNGNAFDVTITKHINDIATDTQGYIGYSIDQKTISLVFRGSSSLIDLLNDFDTTTVTPDIPGVDFPIGTRIMEGIHRPWLAVHGEVVSEIQRLLAQFPEYSLELTGHSLGGSLIYLAYIVLHQIFPGNITGYALASFPIGNQEFADFGAIQRGDMFRGNSKGDGTPNMYSGEPWNFKHYGIEYYSDGSREGTIQCHGNRDQDCSAGNGLHIATLAHFNSFGIEIGILGLNSKCH
ncbi:Alpha/Beta hydrolase protein [Aspergillus transmontanensis]|uniref:Alpha/Beta hydrolase protein n=1 Tax=Aspergillus transmontanensis TaxID=1034304 RepID=A0A5N6VSI4_9EURO|nr:Alpha/Beta hydrolase protein [Aspergillus transmontanensis]